LLIFGKVILLFSRPVSRSELKRQPFIIAEKVEELGFVIQDLEQTEQQKSEADEVPLNPASWN
jgi:hypothetical protein